MLLERDALATSSAPLHPPGLRCADVDARTLQLANGLWQAALRLAGASSFVDFVSAARAAAAEQGAAAPAGDSGDEEAEPALGRHVPMPALGAALLWAVGHDAGDAVPCVLSFPALLRAVLPAVQALLRSSSQPVRGTVACTPLLLLLLPPLPPLLLPACR